MTTIIQVDNLRKSYDQIEAIKGISFSVEQGTLFAFLGANGAGKSTTIEILCTLLKKTSGTVNINHFMLDKDQHNAGIRQSIGVVFQQSLLDEHLSVYENIIHRGQLYGLSQKELADNYQFVSAYLKLEDIERRKYGKLSGGQKRRADIAKALIHRPRILFLDEPTTGLDPQTRQFVWHTIKKLQKDTNMTVFLTTHYMEEAATADKVVVLKHGKVVAEGTPDALKTKYASDQLSIVFRDVNKGINWLNNNQWDFVEKQGIFTLRVQSTLHAFALLKQIEPIISSFEVIKGTMDDVFIHMMEEVSC